MIRKAQAFFLTVFFLGAISLPLSSSLSSLLFPQSNSNVLTEKRRFAKLPPISLFVEDPKRYTAALESYYNDHFGFRSELVSCYLHSKVYWLGVSPIKDVILGKKGWLFFRNEEITATYGQGKQFSEKSLSYWARGLERRRNWLSGQGIDYLFVIASNKHSIYPEYLPYSFAEQAEFSITDEFLEFMSSHSKVRVLDLRPAMLAIKSIEPAYYRTDSHWTDYGASIAAQEIVKTLGMEELLAGQRLQARKRRSTRFSGDLAEMLGMHSSVDEVMKSSIWPKDACLVPRRSCRIEPRGEIPIQIKDFECEGETGEALVFGDSFGVALEPYLAHAFLRMTTVQTRPSYYVFNEFVKKNKPNVVIEIRAERSLGQAPKKGLPISLDKACL